MSSLGETPQASYHVIANGRAVAVTPPATLFSFLQQLGLPPRSVVVELNGEAVAPSEFEMRALAAEDRLEIVRITAGG
jgi:thiamine biosynthesis protein ThiS